MEKEFVNGEESICYDCHLQHYDSCVDCCEGDMYYRPEPEINPDR